MKIIIPDNVKVIMQKLLDNKFETYLIGGAVRDMIFEEEPKDYDVFTNATGKEILTLFPQGKVLGGDVRQTKILTVIVDGVEVSQYRSNGNRTETGNDLKTHCSTCDFTFNSICMNIDGEITDYFDGRIDLKEGIINFVGNPIDRISEDPLRLLRAIRFAAKYNFGFLSLFSTSFDTYSCINSQMPLILSLPFERISEEIMKILKYEEGLKMLKALGVLKLLIPELYNLQEVQGGIHHAENVWEHSFEAYEYCQRETSNTLLKLAVVLHDIGKYDCQIISTNDSG